MFDKKEESMTYLEILDLIERNYKVGDDWVYEKGKSQEIKIIKALLEKYQENRERILELMVDSETTTLLVEALEEAVYLLNPTEEDLRKKAGVYRVVTALEKLKEKKDESQSKKDS